MLGSVTRTAGVRELSLHVRDQWLDQHVLRVPSRAKQEPDPGCVDQDHQFDAPRRLSSPNTMLPWATAMCCGRRPHGNLELEVGTYNAAVYGKKIATDVAKINDGQWHHVAVTISSEQQRFLLRRWCLNLRVSAQGDGGGQQLCLAADRPSWIPGLGSYFNGSIDDLQIYNRALSVGE